MRFSSIIHTVDTHTDGQPTRIITKGLDHIEGATMAEKQDYFRQNFDHVRTSLIAEPRGHRDMYGCVLTQPSRPDADFGIMFLHNSGYMDMCGHATIGLSTALVDTHMVEVKEPVTRIVYDSAGGLVTAHVAIRDGKSQHVTFQNVPGYVHYLDRELVVDGVGTLTVDVAYGGNDFIWFDAASIGLEIGPHRAQDIVDVGMRVMRAANAQLPIYDPYTKESRPINIATALAVPHTVDAVAVRNVHVFGTGQFDRSPGGTGTTARLSVLRAKGLVELDQEVVVESGITDGRFRGKILEEIELDEGRVGYVTTVQGSAHITGLHEFVVDPADPLKDGFLVSHLHSGVNGRG